MKMAVIKTGGKQYLVSEGQYLEIEKIIGAKEGDSVTFDALMTDDGSSTDVGAPMVSGKVTGTVLEVGRSEKKIIVRYKQKSRYHKKRGHRQPFLKVQINAI
jgi:large subunit ribosomal protein L21